MIAYRVIGYWALGAAGTAVAIAVTRRSPQDGTSAAPSTRTADAKEQAIPGGGVAATGTGRKSQLPGNQPGELSWPVRQARRACPGPLGW